tara:strand:- start:69 stop:335 length:267 start_codon:yes stop_codon:yes gene_type:complete
LKLYIGQSRTLGYYFKNGNDFFIVDQSIEIIKDKMMKEYKRQEKLNYEYLNVKNPYLQTFTEKEVMEFMEFTITEIKQGQIQNERVGD